MAVARHHRCQAAPRLIPGTAALSHLGALGEAPLQLSRRPPQLALCVCRCCCCAWSITAAASQASLLAPLLFLVQAQRQDVGVREARHEAAVLRQAASQVDAQAAAAQARSAGRHGRIQQRRQVGRHGLQAGGAGHQALGSEERRRRLDGPHRSRRRGVARGGGPRSCRPSAPLQLRVPRPRARPLQLSAAGQWEGAGCCHHRCRRQRRRRRRMRGSRRGGQARVRCVPWNAGYMCRAGGPCSARAARANCCQSGEAGWRAPGCWNGTPKWYR